MHTGYGEVVELVEAVDDAVAIFGPGRRESSRNRSQRVFVILPSMLRGFTILSLWLAAILPASILNTACDSSPPEALGEAVDTSQTVSLAELLSESDIPTGSQVVVSGSVVQVCRSAGCWFVLGQDIGEEHHELYVDLKPAASFTLGTTAQGRRVTLQGLLTGTPPDLELHASGLVFE